MSDACYCDSDAPSFYWRRTPIARKAHKCDECYRPIATGESYERVTAKWPDFGRIETMLTCARCLALREYVLAHVPCFCWMRGIIKRAKGGEA